MIRFKNTRVMNWEGALRGMRNPKESWGKCDSIGLAHPCMNDFDMADIPLVFMGEEDHRLALQLATQGSDHGKFLRQIFVSVDIIASMSFFWDLDTYTVGVTKNSTSRMHKLGTRLLTEADFDWTNLEGETVDYTYRQNMLNDLNRLIKQYQECDDPKIRLNIWRRIYQDLPQSYIFLRTWTANYEVLRNIYFSREFHKQPEFAEFRRWIETLPYSELITTPRKTPAERKLEKELAEVKASNEKLETAINQVLDSIRGNSEGITNERYVQIYNTLSSSLT